MADLKNGRETKIVSIASKLCTVTNEIFMSFKENFAPVSLRKF